jgi:hypothetical protein
MKKRAFLAPLALSVAALVGTLSVGQRAAFAEPAAATQVGGPAEPAQLLLTSGSPAANPIAYDDGHTSHSSHSSHESHASHSSHSSHYSSSY